MKSVRIRQTTATLYVYIFDLNLQESVLQPLLVGQSLLLLLW